MARRQNIVINKKAGINNGGYII